MDNRKAKRSRSSTAPEDGFWDCSFCTYRNRSESFKCEMCNIRKGTSTRKPRMTQVTQQFVKIENQIEQERKKEKRKEILLKTRANRKSMNTSNSHNKFANAQTISITVNDVTVFITDIELSLENENDFLNTSNEHGTSGGGKTSSNNNNNNNASANNSNGKSEKRTKNGHRNNKDHKNSETNSDTATNNHTSDSTHNLDENNASNSDFNDADSNLNNNFSKLNNGHHNGTQHDFNENSSNNNETEDKDTATNHSDSE